MCMHACMLTYIEQPPIPNPPTHLHPFLWRRRLALVQTRRDVCRQTRVRELSTLKSTMPVKHSVIMLTLCVCVCVYQ